jgi:hypothetical protein
MSLPLILLILLSLALCGVDAFHTNFVPSTRSFQSVLQGRQISKIMPIPKFCKVPRSTVFLNLKDGDGDETSRFESAKPFDKGASEFVPSDMQPANEWVLLKREFLFDWPLLPEQALLSTKYSTLCDADSLSGILQAVGRSVYVLFLCGKSADRINDL